MKKRPLLLAIALLLMLTLLLSSCTAPEVTPDETSDKLQVVSTLFPGYDFIRQIAGEQVELTMLLPPGSESHTFDPTPQDIITIQNCDLFVYVGGESETWVKEILANIDSNNITTIALMDVVDTVEEEMVEGMEGADEDEHGHDHEADEAVEYDEHVWTSPVNAGKIVSALLGRLLQLDPDNAAIYQQNATAYQGQLQQLDADFRQMVATSARRTIIFGDRFPFRYLVEEYGLGYYAAFPGCAAETEASAKTVAFLHDKVVAENIPVVFYLEFSNHKLADIICEQTEAQPLLLHSAHNVSREDFDQGITYLDLMRQNLANLTEALN